MPLKATTLDTQNFSLSGECPHCRSLSVFIAVAGVYGEESGEQGYNLHCAAMQCQGCRNFILGIAKSVKQSNPVKFVYVTHYPVGKPNDSVSVDIPQLIAEDFREALRCHWVSAYNATAEMCRRALEVSCIEFGAKPEDRIGDKIDWVHSKGLITTPLRDMARKIKLGGDRGAHPSPRKIEKEDADALIEFANEYFDHVYVMPAKMAKFDFSKRAITSK